MSPNTYNVRALYYYWSFRSNMFYCDCVTDINQAEVTLDYLSEIIKKT